MQIFLTNETQNYWTFREFGKKETFDIPKEQLKQAFIHLNQWQKEPGATNFSSKLYDLMSKADGENFRKLFNGFPARTVAYCLWYCSTDKAELNKYFGGENNDVL